MGKPLVSVVVPTYNNEKLIENCIESILNQKFKNLELIIVDDCSKDKTINILKKIKDKRLKYFKTSKNSGSAVSRNIGIDNSKGTYIFFIDGDCIASNNWIEEGLKTFKEKKCLGVEGKTIYVSKNYKPTASDDITENLTGGQYITANIAYKKNIIKEVGGFDNQLVRLQDRDLAIKILKFGEIIFSKKMAVCHQKFPWTFKKLIRTSIEIPKARVILFKRHNDISQIKFRIYGPLNFIAFFFPPLIIGAFLRHKYKSLKDLKTLLWIYPAIFIERISLWKYSIKERIFLV